MKGFKDLMLTLLIRMLNKKKRNNKIKNNEAKYNNFFRDL